MRSQALPIQNVQAPVVGTPMAQSVLDPFAAYQNMQPAEYEDGDFDADGADDGKDEKLEAKDAGIHSDEALADVRYELIEAGQRNSLSLSRSHGNKHTDTPVVSTWLDSSLKYGEISHKDLHRLSISSSSKVKPRETTSTEIPAALSPASHANPISYSNLLIYEISAFDLLPDVEEATEPGFSCFGAFGCCGGPSANEALEDYNPDQLPGMLKGRDVVATMSVISRKPLPKSVQEKSNDISVSKRSEQSTSNFEHHLSPSWKCEQLQGPAAGRKRPHTPLFAWNVSAEEISRGSFHVEVKDQKSGEIVAITDFDLEKVFESSYGSATTPHYKQLKLPSELVESIELKYGSLQEYMIVASGVDENDPFGNGDMQMMNRGEEVSGGRLRIRVAVTSNLYLIDLLRGPDESSILTALNLVMRIIQQTDIQQIFTHDQQREDIATEDEKGNYVPIDDPHEDSVHPLKLLIRPENFQYLFSTLTIIENNPELQSDYPSLVVARRRVAGLLANVFTAGIAKFGPLFSSAFEQFGDQLAQFCDVHIYGEDLCLTYIEIIEQIPLQARLEALSYSDGKLVNSLVELTSIERMEDVQVKSLVAMNNFVACLEDTPIWLNRYLDLLHDIGEYLEDQLESWHPQIAEESLKLYSIMYKQGKIKITEEALESLRRVVEDYSEGAQAEFVQNMLFDYDYRLRLLDTKIVYSSCASRAIYPLSNICSYKANEMHTPAGIYEQIDLVLELESGSDSSVFVTHLIADAPAWTSAHAAHTILMYLCDQFPSQQDLAALEDDDFIPFELEDCQYIEQELQEALEARYVVVRINPAGYFRAQTHVEVNFVAVVGYCGGDDERETIRKQRVKNFDFDYELEPRVDHTNLVGLIGPWVGLRVPKVLMPISQSPTIEAS